MGFQLLDDCAACLLPRCDTFQVLAPMEGLNFSIYGLLLNALAVVQRSASIGSAHPPIPTPMATPSNFRAGAFEGAAGSSTAGMQLH